MEIRQHNDPVSTQEALIFRVFHRLFHTGGARRHFGFSRINAFHDADGLPGWNLWLDGMPGAYQILVRTGDPDPLFAEPPLPVCGRLVVRYFPDDAEPVCDEYSFLERVQRSGPLFDATGTPSMEGQALIDESCFVTGHIEIGVDPDRDRVQLDCCAPDRWVDIRTDGLYLKTEDGEDHEAVAPGAADRNVPGWTLTRFLHDRLVGAFCYAVEVAPAAVVLAEKEGFGFAIDRENRCRRVDAGVRMLRLCVSLSKNGSGDGGKAAGGRLEAEGFRRTGAWSGPEAASEAGIDPGWWKARELVFEDEEEGGGHCCYHDH